MREAVIRSVLARHGQLTRPVEDLERNTDLYGAGLSSHASVNVMLALEEEFDFEFPNEALEKATFQSIDAIDNAIDRILNHS